ncbi:hypothetical protein [Gracilibacillus boraciitolerans]|nr:hypothetical protein [Gracilibacillus boraciitolerans]
MYISAKYKVRADENDFPQIGQVIVGKFKGGGIVNNCQGNTESRMA